MSVFVILGLLVCMLAAGSGAVIPVFAQTGNDLNLNVMKPGTLKKRDVLVWKFNQKSNVVRYFPDQESEVSKNYIGRIDVTGGNFSLKLKNLTKADSGVYTAQIIGGETVTVVVYTVTVQDPVSPVELRVDSASGSSDSCNVTVTCSTQDSHINSTFTCDNQTCSQEGGEKSKVTTSGASLHVYVTNDFIVCNHSNQVSWTEDRKKVEQFCVRKKGSSALIPVFAQTGNDLNLNVMKAGILKEGDVLAWKFNGKSRVIKYFPDRKTIVSPNYSGRIDVTVENFSLKLKNPTKADSGVYTAQILGDETVTVVEYTVTVQDPVSLVELRVDSASGSSDSCNVTVTCSTQDSHINSTFTCDTKTCSQEGGEKSEVTTSGASLHVYVTNDFIVCNHSNQVSWTEDRKKVQQFCVRKEGSSAVTPVFVQTGNDLHLNVMKAGTLKEGDVLVWKFNQKSNVVRYFTDRKPIVSPNYTGRIDVTGENYFLKLKNPTKADSGVYTAQFIGDETLTVAEYTVTVQDPVSPVELRVDSASGSSDSCNVTVTCSTQDSHISSTFTCDNQTCSQEGGEQSEVTTSGASLHVYVTNDFIVCNHSNQVSWTKDRKKVEHLCSQQEEGS